MLTINPDIWLTFYHGYIPAVELSEKNPASEYCPTSKYLTERSKKLIVVNMEK